jgi:hypothetical protein
MILKKTNTALISIDGVSGLGILIPKVKGVGYVKSPLGGHHSNEKYKDLLSLHIENLGDVDDIDGYVHLTQRGRFNKWDDGYVAYMDNIKKAFTDLFPRIKDWKVLDWGKFMDVVIVNQK